MYFTEVFFYAPFFIQNKKAGILFIKDIDKEKNDLKLNNRVWLGEGGVCFEYMLGVAMQLFRIEPKTSTSALLSLTL